MKTCIACKCSKESDDFSKSASRLDGLEGVCRDCLSARQRKHRAQVADRREREMVCKIDISDSSKQFRVKSMTLKVFRVKGQTLLDFIEIRHKHDSEPIRFRPVVRDSAAYGNWVELIEMDELLEELEAVEEPGDD